MFNCILSDEFHGVRFVENASVQSCCSYPRYISSEILRMLARRSATTLRFAQIANSNVANDFPAKRGFARSTSYAMYRRCDCLTFSWSTIA